FPTEAWVVTEARKSDVFYFAAAHATEQEQARFIERGGFFYRAAVDTLASMPTRTLVRPVVVMLSSGFMHGWWASPDVVYPSATAAQADFGPQRAFVSQRERARRRLQRLAAAGLILLA